jgi:ABC-type phosphate transport system ATPase subunit
MKIEELFLSLKDKYTVVLVTPIFQQAKRIADKIIVYLNLISSKPVFPGSPAWTEQVFSCKNPL